MIWGWYLDLISLYDILELEDCYIKYLYNICEIYEFDDVVYVGINLVGGVMYVIVIYSDEW